MSKKKVSSQWAENTYVVPLLSDEKRAALILSMLTDRTAPMCFEWSGQPTIARWVQWAKLSFASESFQAIESNVLIVTGPRGKILEANLPEWYKQRAARVA